MTGWCTSDSHDLHQAVVAAQLSNIPALREAADEDAAEIGGVSFPEFSRAAFLSSSIFDWCEGR